MTVSVIIPNLNSPIVDQVVAAVERQTARAAIGDVIVVGQDRYGRVPERARFIATPRPLSAAAARNLGASHARGEYLLFLDSDCIAAPDLLERLLERHRQGHPIVGGSVAIEQSDYWVLCDNLLVFAPFLSIAPPGERMYLPSLNLSIARDLFERIGGFDERFAGASGEDVELCLRLREQGHVPFFEPGAMVYHRPLRTSAGTVWAHLRAFGRSYAGIWRSAGGAMASRLSRRLIPWSGALLAAAPLLALWDVLAIFRATPALIRYSYALPGMIWGRIAWYLGVVEALMLANTRYTPA